MVKRISAFIAVLALVAGALFLVSGVEPRVAHPEATCRWVFTAYGYYWACIPGSGGGGGGSW